MWGFSYYFRSADNEQSIFKAPAGALNAQRRNGRSTADPDQEKLFRSVAAWWAVANKPRSAEWGTPVGTLASHL